MPEISEELKQRLSKPIFAGRKIEAIKIYREQMNVGLKDAKEAVEALSQELRLEFPEQFNASEKSGCGSAAVFLIAVVSFGILATGYFVVGF